MMRSTVNLLIFVTSMWFVSCGGKQDPDKATGEKDEASSEDKVTTDLTYFNFAKPVFETYCVSCHTVPAVRGAPNTFRLDSYDTRSGFPGINSQISQIKATIESGTMPVDETLKEQTRKKMLEWLSAGAPEGDGEDVVTEKKEPSISILEPIFENSVPDAGTYDIILSFTNVEAEQGWSVFYTTESGATAGGTAIATNIPLESNIYTWDTTAVPDGTYYIYVRVLTNEGIVRQASNGSVTIQNVVP